ncbi:hypothetical protein LCGC14_1635450 [marine sediment metagenome]|uniref:Uncharacterized protein n=1 Tax=marine sediment metagenome TaxID=412755 RepID=A0A0F9L0T5_9ZZZZ
MIGQPKCGGMLNNQKWKVFYKFITKKGYALLFYFSCNYLYFYINSNDVQYPSTQSI